MKSNSCNSTFLSTKMITAWHSVPQIKFVKTCTHALYTPFSKRVLGLLLINITTPRLHQHIFTGMEDPAFTSCHRPFLKSEYDTRA